MAIDKSLYAAPQGLDDLAAMDQASPPIEIEMEDLGVMLNKFNEFKRLGSL